MPLRPTIAALLLAALAPALIGCAPSGDAVASEGGDPGAGGRSTVAGVGQAPPSVPTVDTLPVTPGTFSSGESIPERDLLVGGSADGNRVLLLGDSILSGLSRRQTNLACQTLVPLGWAVAVEAETGRFVDFGLEVLEDRPGSTWDAAVVLLGTNYRGDQLEYAATLGQILDELGDIPVVLLTVSEFEPDRAEVNAAIAREVLTRDNIWVVDWASISQASGVLAGDRIHPTSKGQGLLATAIALVLGRAPAGSGAGQCLGSEHTDDSSGGSSGASGGGGSAPSSTPGGSSGSSGGGSSVTATTSAPPGSDVETTVPSPPATDVPVTDPPTTAEPPPTEPAEETG